MGSEEDYVCTLTEESLEKAKKELNEDPKNRMGAVETFRTWIKQQPHFRCKTDTEFLLRFLRYCKFSQLEARKRLETYLTSMTKYANYIMDIDMTQKGVMDVVKGGQLLPLGRDTQGRRVLLFRLARFDPETLDKHNLSRAHRGIFHLLMRDENTSVNGMVYLVDMTGLTLKHQLYWTLEDIKRSMHINQNCTPARIKEIHNYNMGPVGETMMQLFLPLMKKKFRDRIKVHGNNLESVYKVLPMDILPEEYLPDDYTGRSAGSCQSIVDTLCEEVLKPENVAYIREVSVEANASVDESKRPTLTEPEGSFRKLYID